MKGKEFKNNEKIIELLDGNHKIAIDFNAFESLEEIYGDMNTAFNKFSGKIKVTDIKNFLCAGINAAIEDETKHYTPYQIGKLIDMEKLQDYVTILAELLRKAMPNAKEIDEEEKN
jgi:hypothetical protein